MWAKVSGFIRDVRGEFGRVTWPTRDELVNSTGVVLIFSAAFAAFIGFFDLVISLVWRVFIGS
ncbi:MAG: preprotein translocase subunit SecE [Candidatus Latescibacterota bacterium]|jgi:preprotein translocase subunit SecE